MELVTHPDDLVVPLLARLREHDLVYGAGDAYTSLLMPASARVDAEDLAAIDEDLAAAWALYRAWNELYLDAVDGAAPAWIRDFSEAGLAADEVAAHRIIARARLEPRTCRLDYVALGRRRRIAEVQWNSGGLGLFFGISEVCAACFPFASDEIPLARPIARLGEIVRALTAPDEPRLLLFVRDVWLRGERYLAREAARIGVDVEVADRREAAAHLVRRNGHYEYGRGPGGRRARAVYGQGYSRFLPKGSLPALAAASVEGRLWLELPLNFIYREKWGMALPFMPEFAGRFPDHVRRGFTPTALIQGDAVDLRAIVPDVAHPHAARLAEVRAVADLGALPDSLRRCLVIKCGGGTGHFYTNGRGVFRLGGSRRLVDDVLAQVRARAETGEPWIIQPYAATEHPLRLSDPTAPSDFEACSGHMRFMVFGCREGGAPGVWGAVANFGRHWKVSGSPPRRDAAGVLLGTAFTDVRRAG